MTLQSRVIPDAEEAQMFVTESNANSSYGLRSDGFSDDGFTTLYSNASSLPQTCPRQGLKHHILRAYYTDIIVLTMAFVVAMVGNLCVLFAVWRRRRRAKRTTRMYLFIVHLACADLIVALFQVFPELVLRFTCDFLGTDWMCRFVRYLQIVGMYGSTYVLLCTAMDRYLAIRFPMKSFKQTKKRVHITIILAWLLSFVLSTPQLFIWGIRHTHGRPQCGMFVSNTGMRIYVTWYSISVFAFPVTLLAFFYGMIAWTTYKNAKLKKLAAVQNSTRQGRDFAPRASNSEIVSSRARMKTIKMTFVVVIVYTICYTPYFVVEFLGTWQVIDTVGENTSLATQIFYLLASLNSCVNPWIYMGFSGLLVGELKLAFLCGRKNRAANPVRRGYEQKTLTTIV